MTYIALPFVALHCLMLVLLCRQDLKHGLPPDRLTCPLLWCGLLFTLCCMPHRLASAVIGAIAGYAGFALLLWLYRWVRRREGLGYGDVKFLAALGAWHGWEQLPLLVGMASGLALAFVAAQLVVERSGKALKNPLPFGPFLAAAGFIIGWQSWLTLLP